MTSYHPGVLRLALWVTVASLLAGCRKPAVVQEPPAPPSTAPAPGAATVQEAIDRARALVGADAPEAIYASVLECYYGRQSVSVDEIEAGQGGPGQPFNPIPLGTEWVKILEASRSEVELLAYAVIPGEELDQGEALTETRVVARALGVGWRVVSQTTRGQPGCGADALAEHPADPVLDRCRAAHGSCVAAIDNEQACGGMGGCACNSCLMGLESCDLALSACAGLVVGPGELCRPVDDCEAEHRDCETFVEQARANVERLFEDEARGEAPECIFFLGEVGGCEEIPSTLTQEPCRVLVAP
jgi:hypothetical protein